MDSIPAPLEFLLVSAGVSLLVLFALLIYGNTLSLREDDQFHINKDQEEMASDQGVVLVQMKRLKKVIVAFAVLSGVLLLGSASLWVWIGLTKT